MMRDFLSQVNHATENSTYWEITWLKFGNIKSFSWKITADQQCENLEKKEAEKWKHGSGCVGLECCWIFLKES